MGWDAMRGEADNSISKKQLTPPNNATAADEKLEATAFLSCSNDPRYVTIPQNYLESKPQKWTDH
jgi:hypothetical protein